jgi:Kdo2-lipid IVA lauroyltransferase/acyltransferase
MRILFQLLAALPLSVLQAIGRFGGWLLWVTHNPRRRAGLINIARCMPELPPAEQQRIVRASLIHEVQTYVETAHYWLGPEERVKAAVREWRGIEALDRAFAKGRGVILLTLHMGAFEAVAIPMSEKYPFYGIFKPQGGAFNELSVRGRSRFGGRMVPTEGGVRQAMLPVLAQGYGVYYMPDHDPPRGRGLFAPFMGIPAHTPTLVARLVQQSGAPVVLLYGERLPRAQGYIAHFSDAPEDIYDPDPLVSTTAMNRGLEACVRACPEQYWWGYKRFRRRPEGEPAFYR